MNFSGALRSLRGHTKTFGLIGGVAFLYAKAFKRTPILRWRGCILPHPIYLRAGTTDSSVAEQVLVETHYQFNVNPEPKIIVDAGANIGLSAVWFANRYPSTRIIAIEPEPSNFALMARNVRPYPQIYPLRAALADRDGFITLVDPGAGHHGFRTNGGDGTTRAVSICNVMRHFDISQIDILKIDIEGAEREVFHSARDWIANVSSLMAEVHDDIAPGASAALSSATAGFKRTDYRGETIFVSRS